MSTLSKQRKLILEIAAVMAILTMGAFLRFYEIQTRPGFEWDEPLYAAIAQNIVKIGYPTLEIEEGRPLIPNLYHPPFDHYLKAFWFEVTGVRGIGQARILSGIESMCLLLLAFLLVRYVAGRKVALLTLLLLSSDGWLIYTNRLNLLENAMVPIGVAGLYMYAIAAKRDRLWIYSLAGMLLAMAAVYKHTGVFFLLVPILTWFLTRKAGEHHLVLLLVATIVILVYVAGMSYFFGNDYWAQTFVQIRRALGIGGEARGLNYGLTEVIRALTNAYWIFFTTIASLIIGLVLVLIRFIQHLIRRQLRGDPILLSWATAAVSLLAVVALKSPQYWIIMLVPLYAFLASEFGPYLWRKASVSILATSLLIVVILGLNLTTWYFLIIQRPVNALLETYNYAAQSIPANARILTEECIGVQLRQTYYNIQIHRGEEDLARIDPNYVILYFSATAKPPESLGLDVLLQRSNLVTEFTGFKETIKVYRVEPLGGGNAKALLALSLVVETPTATVIPSITLTSTPTFMPTFTTTPTETPSSTTTQTQSPTLKPTEMPTASSTVTKTPTRPSPTVTATLSPSVRRYVVKKGDSLLKVAKKYYGAESYWRTIYEANRGIIKNPIRIYPGQVLVIPK